MTVPDPSNKMLDAALAFAAAGCSVVPVRPDGSKAPVGYWTRWQNERADEAQIHTWFDNGHPGVGVVCGAVSGELILLEAEGRAVSENLLARAREAAFAAGLGDLWRTIAAGYLEITPSGGAHMFYRISDGLAPGNQKLTRRPATEEELAENPDDKIKVLAETRGTGGYAVVAPSHGPVHSTGRSWQLMHGGAGTIPSITLDEHIAICSVFRSFDEMPQAKQRQWPTPDGPVAVPRGEDGELRPGDDYSERGPDWADILTPHGWVLVGQSGRTRHWRRPGKNDGLSATTGHGDRTDVFYVFTTSTEFEDHKPYSKYQAYTLLEYNNDYSAAARELRRQGYGGEDGRGSPSGSVFDLLPPQPAPEPAWTTSTNSTTPPSARSANAQKPPTATKTATGEPASTTAPDGSSSSGTDTDAEPHTSWWPRDLTDIIAGRGNTQPEPAILARDDGHRILYAGKVNGLVGESESGKSWLALLAVKQVLEVGGAVLFYDFEDTADGLVERLKTMGVTDGQLAGFHYVSPEEALHDFAQADVRASLAALSPVLIVVDGFNAAMTLLSLSLTDNTDITKFFLTFLRPLRANDACVLTVDHVTKSKEGRGDYAIGGQAKKAMTDGSYISVENIQPFGRNQSGKLKLTSIKDRPGHVRAISGGAKNIGTVDFQSSNDKVKLRIQTPDLRSKEERGPFMPTFLMEKVSLLLEALGDGEASTKSVCDGIAGRDEHIRAALDRLVEQHYVARSAGARGAVLHRSTRPYRQPHDDPADLLVPEEGEET